MATVKRTTGKQESLSREKLISLYMDQVLEKEQTPGTVYKFCKDNNIKEEEFYRFFGSFEALQSGIWEQFFFHTMELMKKSNDFPNFTNREKVLAFFYTFFEVMTANRSYVLFILKQKEMPLKNLKQLGKLRRDIKSFAKELIRDENQDKQVKLLKQSEAVFSEGLWVQFLFLLKFWMDDSSPEFESTDVAIEKSVNTVFDLFNNTPLERVLDLGKFLWKEKMV